MKNGIIAYLSHKRTENARNKKIIFFAIMKPFKKNTKKGLISWKTKTPKRMNLLH
ncbi:type I restriction endonuclease subunit M [Helicobacter pylori]